MTTPAAAMPCCCRMASNSGLWSKAQCTAPSRVSTGGNGSVVQGGASLRADPAMAGVQGKRQQVIGKRKSSSGTFLPFAFCQLPWNAASSPSSTDSKRQGQGFIGQISRQGASLGRGELLRGLSSIRYRPILPKTSDNHFASSLAHLVQILMEVLTGGPYSEEMPG